MFKASESAISGTYAPSAAVPSCLCPVLALNASRNALYSTFSGLARTTAVAIISAEDCLVYPATFYLLSPAPYKIETACMVWLGFVPLVTYAIDIESPDPLILVVLIGVGFPS